MNLAGRAPVPSSAASCSHPGQVHRGLRDRTGETKRKAARIVGSMCSLVNDPKVRTPAGNEPAVCVQCSTEPCSAQKCTPLQAERQLQRSPQIPTTPLAGPSTPL